LIGAKKAWEKIVGPTTSVSIPRSCDPDAESSSETNVLDALMDALGTTYSEEEHGTALRKFLETDSTGSPASTSDSELLYQDVFG
jgi:hypothetical protein